MDDSTVLVAIVIGFISLIWAKDIINALVSGYTVKRFTECFMHDPDDEDDDLPDTEVDDDGEGHQTTGSSYEA